MSVLQSISDILKFQMRPGFEGCAWDPTKVANYWAPIARKVFASAPENEKALRSEFLMVAASPYPNPGTCPPWDSKIYMIRYVSPDFEPQFMVGRTKICNIGSGAGVRDYKRVIRAKQKVGIFDSTLKAEIRNPGGWGRLLAFAITRLIEKYPQEGIGKHLHSFILKKAVEI